jgi:hypothetical protein
MCVNQERLRDQRNGFNAFRRIARTQPVQKPVQAVP